MREGFCLHQIGLPYFFEDSGFFFAELRLDEEVIFFAGIDTLLIIVES